MRLIDADALEEKAKEYSLGYYENDEWAVPLAEIDDAPTIDIVRCKECKSWRQDGEFGCCVGFIYGWGWKPDSFCSFGERKESE